MITTTSPKTNYLMADIVDPKTRSRMMSRIKGRDTKPEKLVRSALHQRGFRFRLHCLDLPGKPDLVLPRFETAVFVNGCFWHFHQCRLSQLPKSNRLFWEAKLTANRQRDERNLAALKESGWYVAVVWECGLRNQTPASIEKSMNQMSAWLRRRKHRRRLLVIQ